MTKKQPVEDKIIKERVKLLIHYPFFGYLAIGLKLKESFEVPTVATDGEYLFYNPNFIDKLSPKIIQTVIAHETLHCALGHLWRKEARDSEKWNYAADYAVNIILKNEDFTIPPNCLCDDRFKEMETEIIYTKIINHPQKGKLLDSHDKWTHRKKNKPEIEKDPYAKDKENKQNQQEDFSCDKLNDKGLEKKWKERLAAAASVARMQGKFSGAINKLVKDILQPKLNWKVILREMVISSSKNNFRIMPPSKKHLWRNIYLPSTYGETLEIAIGVDTSGSISIKQFQEFIAEIKEIAEQFNDYILHIFFCDAEIHERITLTTHDDWPEKFSKKNGGTNFIPVFDAIANENISSSSLVYLTDGNGEYPEYQPDYPVIWILNSDCEVPWGQKIKIKEE